MISPVNAAVLATTKLKVKRVRLLLTLLITSLLFSILIAASVVLTGFYNSFERFSKEGLSGRYIIAANGDVMIWGENDGISRNKTLITRAAALEKKLVQQKKEKANELGIEYIAELEVRTTTLNPDGSKSLNIGTDIAQQVIAEYRAGLKGSSVETLLEQLNNIKPVSIYKSIGTQGFRTDAPTLNVLEDGKEQYSMRQSSGSDNSNQGAGSFTEGGNWQLYDEALLESLLLDGQDLQISNSIPVIAPYSAVENMLGLAPLSANASASEKRERLEHIREGAKKLTFEVCYRNHSSVKLLSTAIEQQAEVGRNESNEGYEPPNLVYGLPNKPCGAVPIANDTRSNDEKFADEKQQEFDAFFGQETPISMLLKFRVVGINRDDSSTTEGMQFTPEQLLDSMLNQSIGAGWLSPVSAKEKNEAIADIFLQREGNILGENITYYAEFTSAEQAKRALIERSCRTGIGSSDSNLFGKSATTDKEVVTCSRDGRQFHLQAFGGNSILLDQLRQTAQNTILLATLSIGAIAAVILMAMIGKIIAESRREIAVFRALGATRTAIATIYLTYTFLLAILIVTISSVAGLLIAYAVDFYYGPTFSVAAVVAFAISDLDQRFSLIGVDLRSIAAIVLVVLVGALAGAAIPILGSVRRNPMNDMREE